MSGRKDPTDRFCPTDQFCPIDLVHPHGFHHDFLAQDEVNIMPADHLAGRARPRPGPPLQPEATRGCATRKGFIVGGTRQPQHCLRSCSSHAHKAVPQTKSALLLCWARNELNSTLYCRQAPMRGLHTLSRAATHSFHAFQNMNLFHPCLLQRS